MLFPVIQHRMECLLAEMESASQVFAARTGANERAALAAFRALPLGVMYSLGFAFDANQALGRFYFAQAADAGVTDAYAHCSYAAASAAWLALAIELGGGGVARDHRRAFELAKHWAD